MTIHKEGTTTIALCILFIFVLNALIQFYFPQAHTFKWVVYILSFVLFITSLFLFRNPRVSVTANDKAVLSPADGKVTSIMEVEETEFLKDRRIQISIATSLVDVRVNRNPITGIIKYLKYYPAKDLESSATKSAISTAHTTIAIEGKKGVIILIRQVIGSFAGRIAWYIKEEYSVEQGAQFGYNKFGSRVDVLLPVGTRINVELNQPVKAGQTILAEFKA